MSLHFLLKAEARALSMVQVLAMSDDDAFALFRHLSKATQVGMTNDWLRAQGLVSIRNLWMKAHGYA